MIMTFPRDMLKGVQVLEYNEDWELTALPKLTIYDDHFTVQIPRKDLWPFRGGVGAYVAYYRTTLKGKEYSEVRKALEAFSRALTCVAYELADAEKAEQET